MPATIGAAEVSVGAFRAIVQQVFDDGHAVLGQLDSGAIGKAGLPALTHEMLTNPLERLLGAHGIGKYATADALSARITYAGVRPLAIDEAISAVRFLRASSRPAEQYAAHGAEDIRYALDQLRNARLHA